jgi:hypothetical protein
MFTLHSRMALLAGLLAAASPAPALAADVDALNTRPIAAEESIVAFASPSVDPGPMIARESLATESSTKVAVVGVGQPTRSTTNFSHLKRARAVRAASPSNYRSRPAEYRTAGPQLILGTRF